MCEVIKDETYLVIIVLYKCKLHESVAFRSIYNPECKNISYYIYDNSPAKDEDALNNKNIKYVWDCNNGGVSKAYNQGAQYAASNQFDWIILLDQDTEFRGSEYLQKIEKYHGLYPEINLFAPLVKTESSIISPYPASHLGDFDHGIKTLDKLFLINCGICIRLDLFISVGGYEDTLYLDFADNLFIEKLRDYINKWYLIDITFKQNFSNNIYEFDKLWNRFKIYVDCLKIYRKRSKRKSISLYIEGLKHAMGLSLRMVNFHFLRYYISNMPII